VLLHSKAYDCSATENLTSLGDAKIDPELISGTHQPISIRNLNAQLLNLDTSVSNRKFLVILVNLDKSRFQIHCRPPET
jgi:hypothetical protein